MPNAGKSTFITSVSNARPKIADYPFTTLASESGRGARRRTSKSFVIADIPGLIEGAAEGAGLGHQFLRHLQRTGVLLHIVDLAPFDDAVDPVTEAKAIVNELQKYDEALYRQAALAGAEQARHGAGRRARSARQGFRQALRLERPGVRNLGADRRGLRRADLRDLRLPGRSSGRSEHRGREAARSSQRDVRFRDRPGRPAASRRSSNDPATSMLERSAQAGAGSIRMETAHNAIRHRRRETHRRQGRLEPRHQRRARPRSRCHRAAGPRRSPPCARRARKWCWSVRAPSPKACSGSAGRSGRREIHELQAAAAVGQMGLAQVYESQLSPSTASVPRRCC